MAQSVATTKRRDLGVGLLAVVVLAAALLGLFKLFDATVELRTPPPIETLSFERTVIEPGRIEMLVRNDGPDPVQIAQLLINDQYWSFEVTDARLDRLETATISTDYPWEEGLPLNFAVVTSTGVTIEHEVEAATVTPGTDLETVWTYALLGLYIGVIPVVVGLFAFPLLKRMAKKWLGFFLALTVGLLVFLLIDTIEHGLELAAETAASLNGVGLFGIGALVAVIGLFWFEQRLGRRSSKNFSSGLVVAYLIAAGIGLHNLGEGLAVGAAIAAGEVALGTFLVVGFALHNTTEGLAIVAPLGGDSKRPSLWHFAGLGAVAGVPTIFGAWIGGFAFAPATAAFMFGLAAGAIAQVVWKIGTTMKGEMSLSQGLPALGFVAGIAVMYGTGLLIAG
ncbi:MAG: ZIP family metal transporter [Actinomycetota bacterium]